LYIYIYYITSINDFKKDCNNIFESNLSIEVILYRLKKLINKYNQKRNFNNKFLRFIRNYIHKNVGYELKKQQT
jgi:hypothetical protein